MEASGGLLSPANQVLTVAFFFGLIFQAGLASFLLITKSHAKTIFKEGPRLVLVLFLLFGGQLWAQISFGALLIPKQATSLCQGILIFSTIFDQLARVAIEQFLLWKLLDGNRPSLIAFIMQGVLLVRMVAGGVLVGFTRPSFSPACVAQTSLLPAPIVVLSFDIIIISFVIIRAISLGMFGDLRGKGAEPKKQHSKAFILTTAAFILWSALSIIMILGLPGFMFILRMGGAANGLLILVSVVTIFADTLLSPMASNATTPEAQSPFVVPEASSRDMPREVVGHGPSSGSIFARNTSQLFPINESLRDPSVFQNSNRRISNRGFTRLDDAPEQQFGTLNADRSQSARRAAGNRGSSGVFGAIVAAPMINQRNQPSPIRFPPNDDAKDVDFQKKSFFSWTKTPAKVPIRQLGISRPIMAVGDDSEDRPFTRIPTIDLATAAQNDKERRKAAAGVVSPLNINPVPRRFVPAQQQPGKGMSSTVRQIASPKHQLSTFPSQNNKRLLMTAAGANSTSRSLSPGHEEVRRRSPRSMSGFDFGLDEKPKTTSIITRVPSGLPSNPRAQRTLPEKPTRPPPPTVMLMNNIVYENPGIVKTIIQDATNSYEGMHRPKTADNSTVASYTTTLKSADSMIHRPRPYKRDSEKDRALFPAEPKTRHKRSRSLGSALTPQSSMLSTFPGTFDALPALPAVPRTAAELKKILPNDTKSMTFDEKVQLLFPAPPRSAIIGSRRSSVPSLPRIPSEFLAESPPIRSPTNQSSRASKRTTIADFVNIEPSVDAIPAKEMLASIQRESRTSQTAKDQEISFEASRIFSEWDERVPFVGIKQIPRPQTSVSTTTHSTDISEVDDTSTYWGSVHSNVPPVDLRGVRQNARSTFIKAPVKESSEDTIPVMLDVGEASYSSYVESTRNSRQLSEDGCLAASEDVHETSLYKPFHHRIGDQLPTFSEREIQSRTRKMPPPTPLLLNGMGRNVNIVVHTAEPSPIDSPERAVEEIKAQLDRMGGSERSSFDSSQYTGNSQMRIQDRFRMLESLEREMLELEQMQDTLGRNALSTSSSLANSPVPPPKVSLMSQMISKRKSNRLSRNSLRKSALLSLDEREFSNSPSSQSSDNSRASLWQRRLADAQMAYTENAPSLLRNSFNFLAMPSMQAASPTPPESEESEDDEIDIHLNTDSDSIFTKVNPIPKPFAKLWEPSPLSPQAAVGRLWTYPYQRPNVCPSCPEPSARYIRPRPRLDIQLMQISSSGLWKPCTMSSQSQSISGLWRSKDDRSKCLATKQRISVKPKRRTRRLTVLPDIVESPVPVPHNRDTLGIFQFPWGETSDQPIYQPAYNPVVGFSSYNTSYKLNARSMDLEPEGGEYSSSFFDDYDDEESGDSETNFDDSGDEFDENTLFEIADLLKSDEVPSRQSMFSPGTIVAGYSDGSGYEFDSDSDVGEPREKVAQPQIRLPIPPLEIPAKSPATIDRRQYSEDLFTLPKENKDTRPTTSVASVVMSADEQIDIPYTGLFEMESTQLVPYVEEIFPEISISHGSLVKLEDSRSLVLPSSPLPSTPEENGNSSQVTVAPATSLMWNLPRSKPVKHSTGLFNLASNSSARTTTIPPAALDISRRPRSSSSPLPQLQSKSLWNVGHTLTIEHDWISESSVRAVSPSEYSPFPLTGSMTPSSDMDSIFDAASIKTASTKASTLWETMSATTPVWWEARSGSLSLNRMGSNSSAMSIDVKKAIQSPAAIFASREAELNSKIPKLRRQKSREVCQKTKEVNDAARRPKSPETPRVLMRDSEDAQGSLLASLPPMPTLNRRKTITQQSTNAETDREAALAETSAAQVLEARIPIPNISKQAWIEDLNKKAVIIGPAFPKKKKPVVTEAEWVAALNEAVMAGNADRQKRPTVTKEEWITSLEKAVKTEETKKLVSAQLWVSNAKVDHVSASSALWSKGTNHRRLPSPITVNAVAVKTRKPLPAENPDYARLMSTELWQPLKATRTETNWLAPPPALRRAKTWTAQSKAALISPTESAKLWSKASALASSDTDLNMFAHLNTASIRRSASSTSGTLPRLTSKGLFTTPKTSEEAVNWLLRSSSASQSFSGVQTSMVEEPEQEAKADGALIKKGWMLPPQDPRVSKYLNSANATWI